MKIKGLDFRDGHLLITREDGQYYRFKLNSDQMILLLQQIVTALWFNFKVVPRD